MMDDRKYKERLGHKETASAVGNELAFDTKNRKALGMAFWNFCRLHKLKRQEQAVILGIRYNRKRLKDLEERDDVPDDPDKFHRVGHILGIHKNLRILFPHNRNLAYQWMGTPHEWFGGKTPLEFICEDTLKSHERLFVVRRLLDQFRVGT